jgi:NitT/TauT family transport system permease protein
VSATVTGVVRRRRLRRTGLSAASLGLLLVAWMLASRTTRFLPSVGEVAAQLPRFLSDPATYTDILATLQRVVLSVALAVLLGLAGAVLSRRGGIAGQVIDTYVSLAIAIPSTIAALLALFIFRRSELGVYVVVTFVIWPFVVMTLRGGLELLDRKLNDLATAYRFTPVQRMRRIVLPHLLPYVFAAVRSENAHAWRVVVIAEVFAINTGMGARFSQAFDRFLLEDVLLWLLTFMAILLITEYCLLRPLESYFMRWRFGDAN